MFNKVALYIFPTHPINQSGISIPRIQFIEYLCMYTKTICMCVNRDEFSGSATDSQQQMDRGFGHIFLAHTFRCIVSGADKTRK